MSVKSKKHGGKRPGAGRPAAAHKREQLTVTLPPHMTDMLRKYALKNELTISYVLEQILRKVI